jgi:peptide/nickel transport system substrate-binding protein
MEVTMTMKRAIALAAAGAALVSVHSAPALAQKAQDTLRLAINDPFVNLSPYHVAVDEASNFYRTVYETLLVYDERGQKFAPALAKSWTRVDDKTLEFELRDDVTFHNGDKFDADDVVQTINYVADPKVPITFKGRYDWVQKAEKLSSTKVRITASAPTAMDLGFLAYSFYMWDAKAWATVPDKADYGRLTPVGTGVYKVLEIDKNKGTLVERVENYYGDKSKHQAPIKRVQAVPMPDRQTQIAQILTGGIDMIRNASPDDTKELEGKNGLEVSYVPVSTIFFISLDTQGRSGNKIFTDPRVRRALFMSVDREGIRSNIAPGGAKVAQSLDALCFPSTVPACSYSVAAPKYDPDGAKKLLTEAGYPNGFDFEYVVFAPFKSMAEAAAGSMLKAGIRAHLQPEPIVLYRKNQAEGKLTAWSNAFPTGQFPDEANILSVLYGGSSWGYFNDPDLEKLMNDGMAEGDTAKRSAIYKRALDLVNEKSITLPVTSVPTAYVHSKDVKLVDDPLFVGDTSIADYAWK